MKPKKFIARPKRIMNPTILRKAIFTLLKNGLDKSCVKAFNYPGNRVIHNCGADLHQSEANEEIQPSFKYWGKLQCVLWLGHWCNLVLPKCLLKVSQPGNDQSLSQEPGTILPIMMVISLISMEFLWLPTYLSWRRVVLGLFEVYPYMLDLQRSSDHFSTSASISLFSEKECTVQSAQANW